MECTWECHDKFPGVLLCLANRDTFLYKIVWWCVCDEVMEKTRLVTV